MASLLQLLKIRPVWVSLLGVLLTISAYVGWPAAVPQDPGRRGVWLVFGVLALWTIIEWALHFWRQARERLTRSGKLRVQLDSALRQLSRECGERGQSGWRTDAATTLPWLLLLGPTGAGKSRLLDRAGFRRIATCGTEEQASLVTIWLALDATAPAVCVELGGGALNDAEACGQVTRWLHSCRSGPDGLLLVVSLDDLGTSSEDTARALAVSLSPALRRLLQAFPYSELPVHLVVNKCDRIEGLPSFFPDAERRPLGFRIDRPLHTEVPLSLLDARLGAIGEGLWQRQSLLLSEAEGHGRAEVEALLDFPREFALHTTQVRAFLGKLFEQFAADTRARLCEVYFASASVQDGAAHEAARHRRIPTRGPRPGAPPAELLQNRFVHGLFTRALRQAATHSATTAPRLQTLAVWGAAALCVLGVAWMSHIYRRQVVPLRKLAEKVVGVDAISEQLATMRGQLELEPGARNLNESLGRFLDSDLQLAGQQKQLAGAGRLPRLSSPTQRLLDQLDVTTNRFRQCESAGRLLAPMLRYDDRDVSARRPQPLYDHLLRLGSDTGKRRPGARSDLQALGRGELQDSNALAEWLEALYALVIARRANPACVEGARAKEDAAQSLARYFSALWLPRITWLPTDKPGTFCDTRTDPVAARLCGRLYEVFQHYIGDVRDCSGLRDRVDEVQLKDAQDQLERYTSPSGGDGNDLFGGILLTLRLHDLPDSNKGPAQLGLKYFTAASPPPYVFTRSGCTRLARDRSPRSARLACLLGSGAPLTLTAAQEARVARAYQVRNAGVWNAALNSLARRARPDANGANRLGDLSADAANLIADVQRLFRILGTSDVNPGEQTEDMCRDAAIPFREFRWATDQDDESGGKAANADLTNLWQAYQPQLVQLQQKLTEINQPGPPAAQTLEAVKAAFDILGRVRSARSAWIDGLKGRLQPPMRTQGLVHLGDLLAEFEEDVLLELTRKARQLAYCRLLSLKSSAATKVAPLKPADPGFAAAATQVQGELRQELVQYRNQFVESFATVGTCDMRSYPGLRQSQTALPPEFCVAVRQLVGGLTSAAPPPPDAAAPVRPFSLVPIPETAPCAGVSIGYVTLDVPELGKRFKCRVSGIDCVEDGPAQGSSISLRLLNTEGTLLSSVSSIPTLAALLAHIPRHGARVEVDPWLLIKKQQRVRRQVAEVSLAGVCRNPSAALRIYMDEDLGQRHGGAHDADWMRPGYFDSAISKLGTYQCP
jgi:hypothetical protein